MDLGSEIFTTFLLSAMLSLRRSTIGVPNLEIPKRQASEIVVAVRICQVPATELKG